jgi:hypothetical protein
MGRLATIPVVLLVVRRWGLGDEGEHFAGRSQMRDNLQDSRTDVVVQVAGEASDGQGVW